MGATGTNARLPAGTLPWPGGVPGALLLAGLTVALLLAIRRPVVRRLVAVATAAVVLGTLPVRIFASGWPPADWVIVGCAVGQGDALVLPVTAGRAVVVDAGPEPSAVDGCLRRLGVREVSLLVVSHFHADHVGGGRRGLPGAAGGRGAHPRARRAGGRVGSGRLRGSRRGRTPGHPGGLVVPGGRGGAGGARAAVSAARHPVGSEQQLPGAARHGGRGAHPARGGRRDRGAARPAGPGVARWPAGRGAQGRPPRQRVPGSGVPRRGPARRRAGRGRRRQRLRTPQPVHAGPAGPGRRAGAAYRHGRGRGGGDRPARLGGGDAGRCAGTTMSGSRGSPG
ncbi:MBL fold metallo-hydrolase [Micromonospora sp. 4G55]|nr:MBL fold metallo-hydrolase [Micromonospora sp. 4G55]